MLTHEFYRRNFKVFKENKDAQNRLRLVWDEVEQIDTFVFAVSSGRSDESGTKKQGIVLTNNKDESSQYYDCGSGEVHYTFMEKILTIRCDIGTYFVYRKEPTIEFRENNYYYLEADFGAVGVYVDLRAMNSDKGLVRYSYIIVYNIETGEIIKECNGCDLHKEPYSLMTAVGFSELDDNGKVIQQWTVTPTGELKEATKLKIQHDKYVSKVRHKLHLYGYM